MTLTRTLRDLCVKSHKACSGKAIALAAEPRRAAACTTPHANFHSVLSYSSTEHLQVQHSSKACHGSPGGWRLFNTSALAREVGSSMDTQASSGTSKDLSDKDFHRHADLSLGDLYGKLEEIVESAGIPEADLEYSQGVLTLELGKHGTYVINKQSPNKQLWMSSPVSGPVRYDWHDGLWQYKHDAHQLHSRLQSELQTLLKRDDIDLEPEPVVGYGPDVT